MSNFVIITPAHNEEKFIEKTIQSMINQTARPMKWVVVSDASTDRTAEIVRHYTLQHDFIQLIELQRDPGRHFGNKVAAFNRGLTEVKGLQYEFVGNLDADVSFDPEYFERVLEAFARDPKLGLSGGIIYNKIGNEFVTQDETLDSVGGPVQLFRRQCFEEIGGYVPLRGGGIDAAAEITARMKGWRVRKSRSLRVFEHRRNGTAMASPLEACVVLGRRFYSLGYGLVFYLFRCAYRLNKQPYILGSCAGLFGYLESMFQRRPIVLPPETVRYLRAEQRQKLRQAFNLGILIQRFSSKYQLLRRKG
jgi:biofilm PGA synthesis N-glycosyltransferase PgaC